MPAPAAVTLPDIDRLCAAMVFEARGPTEIVAAQFQFWFRGAYRRLNPQAGQYHWNEAKWQRIAL